MYCRETGQVLSSMRRVTRCYDRCKMPGDFFDPILEDQSIVLIQETDLREAEKLIESCEHCNPEGAEIPFDNVLDRVTGADPVLPTTFLNVRPYVRTAGARSSRRRS